MGGATSVNLGRGFIGEAGLARLMNRERGITRNVWGQRTDVIQGVLKELPSERVIFEAADPKVFK